VSRKDVHNSEIPVLCRACEARHRGICGALNPEELIALSRHSSQVKVTSGAELIAEQEEVVSYANVLKGVVKLSKLMADGRQQIVGLQFAPDLLGRPFQDESSVTAEAATDVQLCVFSRAALEKAVDDTASACASSTTRVTGC
jgi:CRP/FNR family transcriptional regulator